MNEHSARPANEGRENGEQSSSEEGSSHLRQDYNAKPRSTIWSRIARLLRPSQGERLREDLTDALMDDTEIGAAFSPEERAMLNNILRFREIRVEDIMIPRVDIDGLDQNMTIGEALILFEETGRSRMPVYDETLDDPKGMIHIRDLLAYVAKQARNKRRAGSRSVAYGEVKAPRSPRPNFDLARVDLEQTVADAGLVRKILFAPPSMLASDLLKTMQAQRTQLALVIDEYGGTDGLVSHEDIVEMVVGDIDDEHDKDEAMFSRLSRTCSWPMPVPNLRNLPRRSGRNSMFANIWRKSIRSAASSSSRSAVSRPRARWSGPFPVSSSRFSMRIHGASRASALSVITARKGRMIARQAMPARTR